MVRRKVRITVCPGEGRRELVRLLRPTSRSGLGSKPFRDSEKGGVVETSTYTLRCL